MSGDSRIKALRAGLHQAQRALDKLEDAQRDQDPAGLIRLEAVLDYASVVFGRTESALLAESVRQALINSFGEIANNAPAAAAATDSYATAILDQLARLPAVQGRDWEQQVREAAANFRRSTSAHLNAIEGEVRTVREGLGSFQSDLAQAREEAFAEVEARQTQFDERLTEMQATVAQLGAQSETQLTSQQEAFEEQQQEQRAAARKQSEQIDQEVRDESEDLISDLQEMKAQAEDLVGAVGAATVANGFGKHADNERNAFWVLFALTVLSSLLAVGAAYYAAKHPGAEVERFIGKLGLSVIFGGIAAYAGSQAKDRRDAEKESRRLQLELKAFGPFIEPLPEKEKVRERIIMARRTFGRPQNGDEPEAQIELLSTDDELISRRADRRDAA